MVEFPQTSVFHLCLPCKSIGSPSLSLFFSCSNCLPVSYISMQHLSHRLGTTVSSVQKSVVAITIMAYQAAMQDAQKLRKGPWLEEEDKRLTATVALLGERRWDAIARASGLRRSGKSCRLRWLNYLRPNLKHDPISLAEEQIILQLHEQWGNKWSRIARRLPGRTDNEIKNYWRTHLRKKTQSQDQGHFSGFMDNAKQDFMIQNYDTNATETSYQDCNSAAGIWKTTDTDSFEVLGSSLNSSIANSPYESRMSDWVLGFSDDKTGFDHYGNFTSSKDQDSYFNIYPPLNTTADETSLWDCSDSLWDLD